MRFLFYDRVLQLEKGAAIVGVKNFGLDGEYLPDHFDRVAMVPGALLIEAVAQVAGWLVNVSTEFRVSAIMSGVEDVVFYRHTRPGDRVILHGEITRLTDEASETRGRAVVDDEVVMSVARILFWHYPAPDAHFVEHERQRFRYFSGGYSA